MAARAAIRMRRLLRALVLFFVLAALAAGAYALIQRRSHAASGSKLVKVERGSIAEKAIAVGQIQPRQRIAVKSKLSGIVKRCLVAVGDVVKAGDPLFEIAPDPTPMESTGVERGVDTARATLWRAQADYERAQELHEKGVLASSDLDARREAFDLATIGVRQAEETRDLTKKGHVSRPGETVESVIRAPASGTILSRAVNAGDPVVPLTSYQPGTELATIAEMTDLVFKGTVDEIDVGKLHPGMTAHIKVGALPDEPVTGKVARIAPQAEQKEGATLFAIEVELQPGKELTLRAGYSANADVVIREKKDVLFLPERLVTMSDDGKKATVEVPAAEPSAPPRTVDVKLGLSDGLNVEIEEGLQEGDEVIERPPKEIT